MLLKKKLLAVHDILFDKYGISGCPLRHDSPFQLAVAVMLSAQCRDDRVNQVTPALFSRWPDAPALATAPVEEVAEIIRPCGLFQNKSRNLVAMAQQLVRDCDGELPKTMAELVKLPGIGRKSANVILGNAFDIPGFPVDTHVTRVLNRLGCVDTADPVKIEKVVNSLVDPSLWTNFSHLLIRHGRDLCSAGRPKCGECPLAGHCDYYRKSMLRSQKKSPSR